MKMRRLRSCCQICQGEHMPPSEVKEGKIELIADCEGVLKINTEKLNAGEQSW